MRYDPSEEEIGEGPILDSRGTNPHADPQKKFVANASPQIPEVVLGADGLTI